MTTEHMTSLPAALAKAQAKMGKAIKESANPAFRSKYADLGNVMDACLPALNECGISVVQPFITIDGKFFIETILLHETGERLSCFIPLIVNKHDMQGLGSAMTYARRYGLMCMAGIAPEDDDGNAAAKAAPPPPPQDQEKPKKARPSTGPLPPKDNAHDDMVNAAIVTLTAIGDCGTLPELREQFSAYIPIVRADPRVIDAKDRAKDKLQTPPPRTDDLGGDDIPEDYR